MVELIWDGKYDKNGKRVAPVRVALPFQTVETVNESAQQRQRTLDLFSTGRDPEWRNRLIWGDKKYVLPSLLPEFAGKVDLIYIDPPFATGADFSFQANVGDEQFTKEANIIEQKAYRDTWGRGLESYLGWLYETLSTLHELLAATGSLYLHLDPTMAYFARILLDEVFGIQNARGEISWKRTSAHGNVGKRYAAVTEKILFYSKSDDYFWQPTHQEYSPDYISSHYSQVEQETGRKYTLRDLTASMSRASESQIYEWHGIRPTASRCWAYTKENMDRLFEQGRIVFTSGKMPRLKLYLDEMPGNPISDFWDDIPPVNSQSKERINYPTQKPESLLERIIGTSSPENSLVLDCFCGSGTTASVAERLGRRWITCDLGRFAIHTARKRLLGIQGVKPFVVQNLGKYERQVWQKAEFGEQADQVIRAYRRFMLDLYHAEPIEGYTWIHGKKGGRLVHVGTVDSPIVPSDITNILAEFRRLIGTGKDAPRVAGVDILGWDFALEMNEITVQQAEAAQIDVSLKRIPREVLEKKAVDQGDIQFFELAALGVDVHGEGRTVRITLNDFMVPRDDVPQDVLSAVKHWSDWIDYWAVDFNFRDDTFHNEWQSYRTRQDRSLQLSVTNTYDQPGEYVIVVKVIDILGNDTTKALLVRIP